jgi:hypothetical protein
MIWGLGMPVVVVVLALAGGAHTTHDIVNGSVDPQDVDIYKLSCNNASSKCASAMVCDANVVTGPDVYEVTIATYAPAAIIAKAETDKAQSAVNGGCSAEITVCRATSGPIKALVSVSHPPDGNANFFYDLHVECRDKFGNLLPAATHTLSLVTNQ